MTSEERERSRARKAWTKSLVKKILGRLGKILCCIRMYSFMFSQDCGVLMLIAYHMYYLLYIIYVCVCIGHLNVHVFSCTKVANMVVHFSLITQRWINLLLTLLLHFDFWMASSMSQFQETSESSVSVKDSLFSFCPEENRGQIGLPSLNHL